MTIDSLSITQLPNSFGSFLVSRPCWNQEASSQMAEAETTRERIHTLARWYKHSDYPDSKTKHSTDCKRVFGRYDLNCPRCIELVHGVVPRKGFTSFAAYQEQLRVKAIRNHDCKKANCGPVCTFGEW